MTSAVLEQLQRRKAGLPQREEVADDRLAVQVGSYGRISDDQEDEATGDRGAGVRRQLKKNALLAEARTWEIKASYEDNDFSAFKDNVIRPAFEQMLEDLEAGIIQGVVVYNLDRLVRRTDDLERLIKIYDAAKKAGRPLHFASVEGDLDLQSDDGITMARVLVAFANKASRDTARRVALKHQETRDAGRPVGGGRPFGYDWVVGEDGKRRHVLNAREASAIHQAALDITARTVTWNGLVTRWNSAGLLTPRGNQWVRQTLKQVVLNPRNAGWMTHLGTLAEHSRTGELIRGQWEPILTDEEFEALIVATTGSSSGTTPQGASRRKYLLAGIARCGSCDHLLRGNRRTDVHFYYSCQKSSRGCGSMSVSGVEVDRLISALMVARLEQAEIAGVERDDERPHTARLAAIADERRVILKKVGDEVVGWGEATPLLAALQDEADTLHAEQLAWLKGRNAKSARVTADAWRSGDLTVEEMRAFVESELQAVYIKRSTRPRGSKTFEPERVQPVWRR